MNKIEEQNEKITQIIHKARSDRNIFYRYLRKLVALRKKKA